MASYELDIELVERDTTDRFEELANQITEAVHDADASLSARSGALFLEVYRDSSSEEESLRLPQEELNKAGIAFKR